MMGKTLLSVDPKEMEADPRVQERLAPVISEPLEASAVRPVPRQEFSGVPG